MDDFRFVHALGIELPSKGLMDKYGDLLDQQPRIARQRGAHRGAAPQVAPCRASDWSPTRCPCRPIRLEPHRLPLPGIIRVHTIVVLFHALPLPPIRLEPHRLPLPGIIRVHAVVVRFHALPLPAHQIGAPPDAPAGHHQGARRRGTVPRVAPPAHQIGAPPDAPAGHQIGAPPVAHAGHQIGAPPDAPAGHQIGAPPVAHAGHQIGAPPVAPTGHHQGAAPAAYQIGAPPVAPAGHQGAAPDNKTNQSSISLRTLWAQSTHPFLSEGERSGGSGPPEENANQSSLWVLGWGQHWARFDLDVVVQIAFPFRFWIETIHSWWS